MSYSHQPTISGQLPLELTAAVPMVHIGMMAPSYHIVPPPYEILASTTMQRTRTVTMAQTLHCIGVLLMAKWHHLLHMHLLSPLTRTNLLMYQSRHFSSLRNTVATLVIADIPARLFNKRIILPLAHHPLDGQSQSRNPPHIIRRVMNRRNIKHP